MLKNGVNSVLITDQQKPVGVINDRDILKDIVDKQKNPEKTLAKDLNYTPLINLQANEYNDYSHEAYGRKRHQTGCTG